MRKYGLSVIIPTYNRKEQLKKQLELLLATNNSLLEEIIILDNHSDYDITTMISSFELDKFRIVIQPINVRVNNNLASIFVHIKTKWFWLLSDDDEIETDSIDKIYKEIEDTTDDVGLIKFSRTGVIQQNHIVGDLKDFIDYYHRDKEIRGGDLVFISTNVYNIEVVKKYIGYAFEYAYTYIAHLIPIFKGLEQSAFKVKFSDKEIVKYIPPRGDGYSFATVGKGLSTLSHLPLDISKKDRKRFLMLSMSISYKTMILWSLRNDSVEEFRIIYNNIYRYYLSFTQNIIAKTFMVTMSYSLSRKFLTFLYKKKYN